MKVTYDADQDLIQIDFGQGLVTETSQIAPGIVLGYDEDGHCVGIEILKASQTVENPWGIVYCVGKADLDRPQPYRKGQ